MTNMLPGKSSVTFFLPDKMGGLFNFMNNLALARPRDEVAYRGVLINNLNDRDTRSDGRTGYDEVEKFEYRYPPENLASVFRRLRRCIPDGPGVVVVNELLDVAMIAACPTGKPVIQILHGDYEYYYNLAVSHESAVDVFVTYTQRMFETLQQRLPHRHESILNVPYGIPLPERTRKAQPGLLRLLFVGRIRKDKGVFDLLKIDQHLRDQGVRVVWTIHGKGPDEEALKKSWATDSPTRWTGILPMEEVYRLYLDHDVFVLPSRAEGFPLTVLEAMAAGMVPVVSDLPSGIPEVVDDGASGFRCRVGAVDEFAKAISQLDRDRNRLESMGWAARQKVIGRYEVRDRAAAYHALFREWTGRVPRASDPSRPVHRAGMWRGCRLDRPWLPNWLVVALRTMPRLGSRS